MNTTRTTATNRLVRCATALCLGAGTLAALGATSSPAHATTALPQAALAAAPVGKLAPSGCTRDDATATDVCDLYAMAGTTQVLGRTLPIWGFSSTGSAGSATAPGPVLAVQQGDNVTVTLHNQLADDVSLAFPGQPATGFTAGLDSTVGAAPGSTRSYTFTANRAGTFLYEAGHTPGGARQVAMGLAGALVVLSADGTASGQAYDDEAVVVLSEIDPRLNGDPAGFDMRNFRPAYRLINGRPFPTTDPIPTDQGHQVLIRYVNAGTVTHPMATLGATQLEVSDDGHPRAHAQREIVATILSGTTADAIVTMPSGEDSKVTLMETGGHLHNNGQTELDPTQVSTGGMMTFLDTNAPTPTDDHVGPVSRHLAVFPSPSAGLTPVSVTADLSDASSGGSAVDAAEILVDDPDIGVGAGLAMTGAFGSASVTGAQGSLPVAPEAGSDCASQPYALSCLDAGKHTVYVRAHDAAGNWGALGSVVLNLPKVGPATTNGSVSSAVTSDKAALTVNATGDDTAADGVIDAAEMFLDTAGANGSGRPLTLNRTAAVVSEDGSVPATPASGQTCTTAPVALSCLTEGTHHLLLHSHDSLGLWGPVLDVPFTLDRTGPAVDAASITPNPSNGVLSAPGNTGYLRIAGVVTDRETGGAVANQLKGAEAFVAPTNPAPPAGSGLQLLAVDGKYDSPSEQVYGLVPLSQVKAKADGSYQVLLRGKDVAGNWGNLFAIPLTIDKLAPTLASVAGSPNPTAGAQLLTLTAPVSNDTAFQTAEFWTGTTDPGVGKGTRVQVSYVGSNAVVAVPLTGITPGAVRFNLRVQDLAGNWSNAVNTTVTVSKPNAIFSDTFDSGTLNSWSARTNTGGGSMVVSPTAGLPSGGANQGLLLTGPGTHFVTDNTPAAEGSYHARFQLSPNTFTSGAAAAVDLFDARTGGNGNVFTVNYRRSAGTSQVQVVMARTTGGTFTSGWQTLPAGAHEIRVDWVAGPAIGASPGSLRLSVDGIAVVTQTGNTSGLSIESARLGIVAGTSATSTGNAYVDSFESTRYTLP
ncbi:multicopper oxidase domain-containing protein [Nocardioides sp. CER19]|uniref:multicopper oxidase domain-containing protein n=1 Tax=Nocardioides sp. CER19 TaxID=3038538 RepID=UPI00244C50DC|nr:multicopper oxidase domain-containing protein [Nocardioides sp. CER19]MDH2413971.1 multicopper oxidase domain-containing protein [Nocardioides sp. CER19]